MKQNFFCTFLFVIASFAAAHAQQAVTYKAEMNAKGTYDLVNSFTREAVLKGCDKVEALQFTQGGFKIMDDRYLVVIRKKKMELFQISSGTVVFSQKEDGYSFKNIEKDIAWSGKSGYDTIRNPEFFMIENGYDACIFNAAKGSVAYKLRYSTSSVLETPVNHHFIVKEYFYSTLVDRTGMVIMDSLNNVKEVPGGNYIVQDQNGVYNIRDAKGKPLNGEKYSRLDSPGGCGDLLLAVNTDKKVGVIKPSGRTVIPFEYSKNDYSNWDWSNRVNMGLNGVFFLYKENRLVVLDSSGKVLADSLSVCLNSNIIDNRFVICTGKSERQGIFDTQNKKMTIPVIYDLDAAPLEPEIVYKKHLIGAVKNNRWGMLNMETGETVIPFLYQAEPDQHLRWPYNHKSISNLLLFDNYFIIKKNGMYGAVNIQGKELTPFEYENFHFLRDWSEKNVVGLALMKNGYWGVVDHLTMKPVLPFEFSEIQSRYLRVKKEENGVIREGELNDKMEVIWKK